MTTYIKQNIEQVHENIALACQRANRAVNDVTLVAVSKRHPAEFILEAYEAGVTHFGENRIEESQSKIPQVEAQLSSAQLHWHMIGHIQSRKTKHVVPLFQTVHSIDTRKLANKLSTIATEHERTIEAFVEINISGEETKSGFSAYNWQDDSSVFDELVQHFAMLTQLPNLKIVGLMTMAPYVADAEITRPYFASLAALRTALEQHVKHSLPYLSMGMTNDYPIAIEEGATHVRIGTAIFGERD